MMLAPTCADPDVMISPQQELRRLEELRLRILESLDARLQGPLQRRRLRVKLIELNSLIANIRLTLALTPVSASQLVDPTEAPSTAIIGQERMVHRA